MTEAFQSILDAGALGATVVILYVSHFKLQQRIDKMAAGFAETVTALQDKQEAREDKIRERYDAVLAEHIKDRQKLRDSLEQKVSRIETLMDTGLSEMRSHYAEAKMHALAKGKGGK